MLMRKAALACLGFLKKHGSDQAQCVATDSRRFQIKAEAGELTLLRSTTDASLKILAVKGGRQGQVSVNTSLKAEVEEAALQAIAGTKAGPRDAAYGVSEFQPARSFRKGDKSPDLKRMRMRMAEFLRDAKKYPGLRLAEASLGFTFEDKLYANSNGVRFHSEVGFYDLDLAFSSSSGAKSSSVNFTYRAFCDLSRPLMARGELSLLLEQSVASVRAKPVSKKFVGDIIVSPDCLGSFLGFITEDSLRDSKILAGTSPYKNRLGSQVAGTGFTLRSRPLDLEISPGYYVTGDGYKADNIVLVENGILRSYLLSRYGAKKTGLPRAGNSGGGYIVDSGPEKLIAMVKAVRKGLLVTRFSGGAPNQKGDFSGIAKNSFYIENGKIRFPVSETMIAGNIPEMFLHINAISRERLTLGDAIYPWISFSGITVSGK